MSLWSVVHYPTRLEVIDKFVGHSHLWEPWVTLLSQFSFSRSVSAIWMEDSFSDDFEGGQCLPATHPRINKQNVSRHAKMPRALAKWLIWSGIKENHGADMRSESGGMLKLGFHSKSGYYSYPHYANNVSISTWRILYIFQNFNALIYSSSTSHRCINMKADSLSTVVSASLTINGLAWALYPLHQNHSALHYASFQLQNTLGESRCGLISTYSEG